MIDKIQLYLALRSKYVAREVFDQSTVAIVGMHGFGLLHKYESNTEGQTINSMKEDIKATTNSVLPATQIYVAFIMEDLNKC